MKPDNRRYRRGQLEDDCLHLLWCVANDKPNKKQSYSSLAKRTDIPQESVWNIINLYGDVLKDVAYKYNYRVRIKRTEGCILQVVYDGPNRGEQR